MRTSSRRALPAIAAVAGAAALAGTFSGTAVATTGYEPATDLEGHGTAEDGPTLGDAPSARGVALMSFSQPRLRSAGLLEDADEEEDGHRGYDGSGDGDFRDDWAEEDYTDECGYEYNHTDHGMDFAQCDIHSAELNNEDAENTPYWERGDEYYSRQDGETKTADEDDFDPDEQDGHLEDESQDFDGDWESEFEDKQAEEKAESDD